MRGVLLEDGKYICPSEERRVREESTGLEIENCCKFGATIEKGQSIIRRRIAKGNMPARCLLCNTPASGISHPPRPAR